MCKHMYRWTDIQLNSFGARIEIFWNKHRGGGGGVKQQWYIMAFESCFDYPLFPLKTLPLPLRPGAYAKMVATARIGTTLTPACVLSSTLAHFVKTVSNGKTLLVVQIFFWLFGYMAVSLKGLSPNILRINFLSTPCEITDGYHNTPLKISQHRFRQ